MTKLFKNKSFLFFLFLISLISCTFDIKELELKEVKYGSLKNNEYDFYKITLPNNVEKNGQIVFELEPNTVLDSINNIVSDPNLYISIDEKHPNDLKHDWGSSRFGDETISLGPQYCKPYQYFHIGVHCKQKCNYILRVTVVKSIVLQLNKINSYTINPKTVMKFSFKTKNEFNELNVNVVGSFLKSFNAYLATKDASSSNTLPAEPTFINGYRFTIKNVDEKKGINSGIDYELIIDNRNEKQDLSIWLKYDNEDIKIKEAETSYDSIPENKASCYYYAIHKSNKNKDIIFSTTLFNGLGFIYISGFSPIDGRELTSSFKNKDKSYSIIQNKAILLTQEDFKSYGRFNDDEDTFLHFCFYAEKNTSLSMKIYLMENFKNLQKLNEIYPGIKFEDVLPRNSLNRYRLQYFDINNDLSITLSQKKGKSKLYIFMIPPDKNDIIFDLSNFEPYKKSEYVLEAQSYFNGYYLYLRQEQNKCTKNIVFKSYNCYLSAIIVCESNEDCTYDIFFDHAKKDILMEPKQTYTNVISQNEVDSYSISIKDPSVKNIAIVLNQNTGKTSLKINSFLGSYKMTDRFKSDDFMLGVMKISAKSLSLDNLVGNINLAVEGLSYASYSLYYYVFNEEENEESLDQEKVSMKLEKGKIIKDIFMDNHRFKVYMYDSSTNGKKTDLTAVLVETDEVNSELYIFKDLNDFSISDDKINGYLWKGEAKDYCYIDKNDKKYLDNDILYIMVYKKTKSKKNTYTNFYLGVTDETTPFLLNEAVEFKMHLNKAHNSQKFFYYYMDDQSDLQISLSLFHGHIFVKVQIENFVFAFKNIIEENSLIRVPKEYIYNYCKEKLKCPINIEIINDNDYLSFSYFLIACRNTKNLPTVLRQGIVNKRTILSGEEQYFIVDLKPDKTFGSKITAFFNNGQGEIYVRHLLNSEIYNVKNFPNELNYEYKATYKTSKKGFYLIEIPYDEISKYNKYRVMITVRGIFPGYYATTIEYSLSISNIINELVTDKNYRLFISQGEITHFHFKVETNKKRLYISMTNKEKDANMFLNYDKYIESITDYHWKNIGAYNEYIDISSEDSFFVSNNMNDIDGEYYLAIQGLDDSFYNLYISTQDVKIMTISKGDPAGCTCETENDNCYFRYENINDPSIGDVFEQNLIFYTEYTYGSGDLYGKLYPNGNMEEIINSLPSKSNHEFSGGNTNDFLFVNLDKKNQKYTFSSVLVIGVQCKQRSLFDLSAVSLDKTTDATRNNRNVIFMKINQDNIYYLSKTSGKINKFIYYIYKEQQFNFQVKALLGKAQVHTYTNDTSTNYKFSDDENREITRFKNYHHISDFSIDANKEEEKEYSGTVRKEYGKGNYMYIEVNPVEDCLINININYDEDMTLLPLNKEITGIVNKNNYYAYIDFMPESEDIVITVTALDITKKYNVYIKKNLILKKYTTNVNEDQSKYSKPNSKNYDIKGTTNSLTSAISLRIKNVPKHIRDESIVRILINVESQSYSFNQKIKIIATPVINNVNRIKPQQNTYYFTAIEKKYSDKILYQLKNSNKGDDLMIIEISACKGNFIYTLTDSPPKDTETYIDLTKRSIDSNIYSSNGKKIITVRNLESKELYLMVYGARNPRNLDLLINEEKEKENKNNKNNENSENNENKNNDEENKEYSSEVEILFFYFTISQKNYNYLVTKDSLSYESIYDSFGVILKLPELKRRDTFGREKYVDYMNYTFIISEKKVDYAYMESTCYLTKLMLNKEKNNEYSYIKSTLDKESNSITVEGFRAGKTYYMNVLIRNNITGEVITYKPIMFTTSLKERRIKIIGVAFLTAVLVLFTYFAYNICRKYRIEKAKLTSLNIETPQISSKKKNVDKKKYSNLTEDEKSLNNV